jgi:RNA polymerase sigma-70 factor (ECF subfamily)
MATLERTLSPGMAVRAGVGLHAEEFDRLVREHQRRIYRVLFGVLRDHDVAASLAQNCFLRAWQSRASYRGEASVATWLTRIAINLALDHQRSRRQSFWKRMVGLDEPVGEAAALQIQHTGASPERQAIAQQQAGRLWAAAAELPAQQRVVFVLRFAEEMSLEEIAAATDLQLGTVKSHLSRALAAVRARMREA